MREINIHDATYLDKSDDKVLELCALFGTLIWSKPPALEDSTVEWLSRWPASIEQKLPSHEGRLPG